MEIFLGLAVFIVIAYFSYAYYIGQYQNETTVKVPAGSIAWDGETVYPAGTISLPNHYQLISIDEQITPFGVDVLGLISVIDTSSSESGHSSEDGYNDKGPFSNSAGSTKSGYQSVTTRQPDAYKYRFIIVWKPNIQRMRQFVKAGNIPDRLAELLRTIPDVNLNDYADTLGIEFVKVETPKKKKSAGSVELADGTDIPY
jgi:hypothetical protein